VIEQRLLTEPCALGVQPGGTHRRLRQPGARRVVNGAPGARAGKKLRAVVRCIQCVAIKQRATQVPAALRVLRAGCSACAAAHSAQACCVAATGCCRYVFRGKRRPATPGR